ncbi:MAG: MlaD family protein [Pseudomonadota bacterium]
MAAPRNHWKLGLFIVIGLAMAMASVVLLGVRSMQQEVVIYVSYFDESVEGLEVGSPIKFRGVTIGTVGKIQVAPDHRRVEVESELGVEELARLGLDIATPLRPGAPRRLKMAADLRLQLASSGLTGVKFLQLDFFDVTSNPPPVLPFEVPKNYIPTTPSLLKNLSNSVNLMMNKLPEITEQAASILVEIESIIADVNEQQIPEQISATIDTAKTLLVTAQQKIEQLDAEGLSEITMRMLDTADSLLVTAQEKLGQLDIEGLSLNANRTLDTVHGFLTTARAKLKQVDAAGLSRSAKQALADVSAAVSRLDGVLASIGRDGGLLTSFGRTSDAISETLRDADGIGGQLVDTLVSVQEALRSIRQLTEALEEDPDMLLKGRRPKRKQ